MTKIGVIADSHRAMHKLRAAMDALHDCSYIVHLGDHDSDMEEFYPLGNKLRIVSGNCDLFSNSPGLLTMQVEGVKIMAAHGDAYGVKYGLTRYMFKAKSENVRLALYGHTHIRNMETDGELTLLNPGALKDGRYAVITVDGDAFSVEFRETPTGI